MSAPHHDAAISRTDRLMLMVLGLLVLGVIAYEAVKDMHGPDVDVCARDVKGKYQSTSTACIPTQRAHSQSFSSSKGQKEHPNYAVERARIHGHKADERSSAKSSTAPPAADTDELYLDTRVTSTSHAGEQDTAAATVARWRR